MSTSSTIDRACFQEVLSSAFAVQQSQTEHSLAAFDQIDRSITTRTSGSLKAVHPIVTRARDVADNTSIVTGISEVHLPFPELDEDDRNSGAYLSHLASTLSAYQAEASSAEIALDLTLDGIAEQARVATNASAVAITVKAEEKMAHRAYAGTNAAQLCNECIRTREVRRCDDTETDSCVESIACRRLGIRSFVIFPLLRDGILVGLFEIFSSRPSAFGEQKIEKLRDFSHQVLVQIDCAIEFSSLYPPEKHPTDGVDAPAPLALRVEPPDETTTRFQRWKVLMPFMAILGTAPAVLLGWMLGRSASRDAVHKQERPAGISAKPNPALQRLGERKDAEPIHTPATRDPAASSGGLVVYENGKIVFRLKPSQAQTERSAQDFVLDSAMKARTQLVYTVNPEYPQAARQQHIQGPVVLEAKVGAAGQVEDIAILSGNSMLAPAASHAVLKWRFRPVVQNSRGVPFQIRIKVRFVLP